MSTFVTARAASGSDANTTSAVATWRGRGRSFSVTSVTIASVPSLPTRSAVRSYPATPLMLRLPTRRISPVGTTTVSPSTYSRVTPYLSARGPPAFSATLPPMVHSSSEFGSGG